jgi:hypothetical protein
MDEDKLREVLREAILDLNKKPNYIETRFKEMMHTMYNITPGDSADILNGKLAVELMSDDMMFKLTSVLFEINSHLDDGYNTIKLDVTKYFFDNEINKYKEKIKKEKVYGDIIFDNWLKIDEDHYKVVLENDELYELCSTNRIRYNPETQRDLTIKETKTGIVKQITYSEDALNDIVLSMENNRYITDDLSFNVNPDYYEPPRVINNKLVASGKTVFDCIDGYHRIKAFIIVKMKNPNWNKRMSINIMSFDKDKANQWIIQQDEKVHLSDEQVTRSDNTDAANAIIKKLNESSTFIFRDTLSDIKYSLNKMINKIFNPKKLNTIQDRQDAAKLSKTIEKNINDLIEEKNLFSSPFTKEEWFVYLYLLKYSLDSKKNFVDVVSSISVDVILNEIAFVNEPLKKHYNLLNEVIKNV